MSELTPFTVVFEYPGMPSSGSGPISTVTMVDGELPTTIVDPIEQGTSARMPGVWLLVGTDLEAKLAIYRRLDPTVGALRSTLSHDPRSAFLLT